MNLELRTVGGMSWHDYGYTPSVLIEIKFTRQLNCRGVSKEIEDVKKFCIQCLRYVHRALPHQGSG